MVGALMNDTFVACLDRNEPVCSSVSNSQGNLTDMSDLPTSNQISASQSVPAAAATVISATTEEANSTTALLAEEDPALNNSKCSSPVPTPLSPVPVS